MRTQGVNVNYNGYVYPAGGTNVSQAVAVHKSAADVDGIQFKFNGGTIKSGLIRMYGLKKA